MVASIGFDIFAKDRASKTFNDVGDSADKTSRRFGGMSDGLKKAAKVGIMGLAGGAAIAGGALVKMTQAAIEDEAGQARLAKSLKNSAGATAGQVAQTEKWITKQGTALGVTDDEMRPALARLVQSTGDVGKGQKLAALAMDVSAGSGQSLGTVAKALAKAQDGNVAGLAKLGVKTKDAEGKTRSLKDMTADLGKMYKGQAASQANTFAGKMARLKLTLSEAGETIGSKLLPHITKMATFVLNKVVPAVTKFAAEMQNGTGEGGRLADKIRTVGTVVTNVAQFLLQHKNVVMGVVAAFVAWKAAMVVSNAVTAIGTGLVAAQTAAATIHAGVTKGIAVATTVWTVAQKALNIAMRANPIGLVITALTLLVGGLVLAYKKSDTFRAIVDGAFTAIKTVVLVTISAVKAAIGAAWSWIQNTTSATWKAIKTVTVGAFTAYVTVIRTALQNARTVVSNVWQAVRTIFSNVLGAIGDRVRGAFMAYVHVIQNGLQTVRTVVGNVWSAIRTTFSNALSAIGDRVGSGWARVREIFGNSAGAIRDKVSDVWGTIRTIFSNALSAVGDRVSGGWQRIRDIFSNGAGWLRERANNAWDNVKNAFGNGIEHVVWMVGNLGYKVYRAVGDLGGVLRGAGQSIVRGLIDGINDMFNSLRNRLGDLTRMLPNWKGPMSVDKKILRPSGAAIMGGLMTGISDQMGPLKRQLGGVTSTIEGLGQPRVTGALGQVVGGASTGQGSGATQGASIAAGAADTYVITVNGALDPNAVAQQIQQLLSKRKRVTGTNLGLA